MSPPLVSVIMPCWNAARYLDAAVESIAAQTFSEFEVVAVDDGSEDETPKLLEAWARRRGSRGSGGGGIALGMTLPTDGGGKGAVRVSFPFPRCPASVARPS